MAVRGGHFAKIDDVLAKFKSDEDKYISQEFQKYGYELARELGDLKNTSLYIKLAKDTPRGILEAARNFVKDAVGVKNKPALFLWKLKQMKDNGGKTKNTKSEALNSKYETKNNDSKNK